MHFGVSVDKCKLDGQLLHYGKPEFFGSGGSLVAKLKLKGIDGKAPPGVELAAQFDSTRENLPGPDIVRIDRLIALS